MGTLLLRAKRRKSAEAKKGNKISLNTATELELDDLLGPNLAPQIVDTGEKTFGVRKDSPKDLECDHHLLMLRKTGELRDLFGPDETPGKDKS